MSCAQSCSSDLTDIEGPNDDYDFKRHDTTDDLIAESDEADFHELKHDTDLATLYGDHFREVKVDNPYFKLDMEVAKKMNQIIDPDSIPLPIHAGADKLDLVKLRAYMNAILAEHAVTPLTANNFEAVSRKVSKQFGTMYRKIDLYYVYCLMCRESGTPPDNKIRGLLQTHSFRSQSGVMVYSVFTHPFYKYGQNGKLRTFSCKFDCRYCPDMPTYPRSYIPGEPGNDKAHTLEYDTVKQVHARASAYTATGHINDKAEVIVLGGTWHSYPLKYRRMFITLLYYAFNTLHENRDRPVLTMDEEIRLNETSKCRVIGLTIETRPDQITPQEIIELRKMGVTRVQLGVQHTNIRILNRVQRRCTPEDAVNAIRLLKDSCFKVDIHLMPDLPKPYTVEFEKANKIRINSKDLTFEKEDIDWSFDSVKEDEIMFEEIFHSQRYRPDQVKIYPCEVIDWTGIKRDFEEGKHVPYGTILPDQETNELIELLIRLKSDFPEECRINRVIRDIPEGYVLGGIKDTGGRQRIERMMKERGLKCACMRCREIKKKIIDKNDVRLKITHLAASDGDEYFLQYVTSENDLVGFLRLRISKNSGHHLSYKRSGELRHRKVVINELVDTALIRELHVYGEAVQVNREDKKNADRSQQHAGYGTRLLVNAFELAKLLGYTKIAVISGEGVKPYYRRFGFYDGELYLLKNLNAPDVNQYTRDVTIDFNLDSIIHKADRVGEGVYSKKEMPKIYMGISTENQSDIHIQAENQPNNLTQEIDQMEITTELPERSIDTSPHLTGGLVQFNMQTVSLSLMVTISAVALAYWMNFSM